MSARARKHLVIFARRPAYGVGKRRLAADVGDLEALRFQRGAFTVLVRRLSVDRRWRTWIAITPDRPRSGCSGARVLPQGSGDLGRRMSRVLRRLPPGRVVFVGTDAPQVLGADIAAAFAALGRAEAVFGPAADGGYWLAGLSHRLRRTPVFADVRWSTPDALSDTLRNLAGRRAILLRRLEDVDDGAGLRRLHARDVRPLGLVPAPDGRARGKLESCTPELSGVRNGLSGVYAQAPADPALRSAVAV